MAASYGVGSAPGIDLPTDEQATGSYADRETRLARWKANKAQYCADAAKGFPSDPEPGRSCLSHRAGQGELHRRLALPRRRQRGHGDRPGRDHDVAAAAGGRLLGAAQRRQDLAADASAGQIVNGSGHVVKTIQPKVRNTVPVKRVDAELHRQLAVASAAAGRCRARSPTCSRRYQNLLGGKTGTAEVFGQAGHLVAGLVGADLQDQGQQHPREVRRRRHGRAGRHRREGGGSDAQAHLGRPVRHRRPADHRRHRPGHEAAAHRTAGQRLHLERADPEQAAGTPGHRPRRGAHLAGTNGRHAMTLLARDPRSPFPMFEALSPLQRRARGYDWVLIATALALSLIGAMLVWAATRDTQRALGLDPQAYLYRHLMNLVIAAVLMVRRVAAGLAAAAAVRADRLRRLAARAARGVRGRLDRQRRARLDPARRRFRGAAVGVHEAGPDRRHGGAVHPACRRARRGRSADRRRTS